MIIVKFRLKQQGCLALDIPRVYVSTPRYQKAHGQLAACKRRPVERSAHPVVARVDIEPVLEEKCYALRLVSLRCTVQRIDRLIVYYCHVGAILYQKSHQLKITEEARIV